MALAFWQFEQGCSKWMTCGVDGWLLITVAPFFFWGDGMHVILVHCRI